MSRQAYPEVLAHWQQSFEDFRTSSGDFYDAVMQSLARRKVPDIGYQRIRYREGGVASADREYFRVQRRNIVFDICAAPFGTGYFFSWWLAIRPPTFVDWMALLVIAGFFVLNVIGRWQSILGGVVALLTLPLVLWLVAGIAHRNRPGLESAVMMLPVVGTLYRAIFRPTTYYQIDTALMFRAEVEAAVKEVISGLRASKGLRALTTEEEKPVLSELLSRQ
ncbi:MAG: hypothetical protein ACE15D_18995 [Candidatus Eisenbacteria bacterium]